MKSKEVRVKASPSVNKARPCERPSEASPGASGGFPPRKESPNEGPFVVLNSVQYMIIGGSRITNG